MTVQTILLILGIWFLLALVLGIFLGKLLKDRDSQ